MLPYFSAGDSSVLGSQFRDIVLERSALERNCGGEDGGDGGGEDCENDDDTLNIENSFREDIQIFFLTKQASQRLKRWDQVSLTMFTATIIRYLH